MSALLTQLHRIELAPSHGSERRVRATGRGRRRPNVREQGVALIMVMGAITLLAVLLADFHESTGTSFAVARSERDSLQAEMMAKSGLNLTRLLVANEPTLRATVTPIYMGMMGRAPPQLPVWRFADSVLKPFCNLEEAKAAGSGVGIDFDTAEGLGNNPGTCQIVAIAENAKINVNQPLVHTGDAARRSLAMQLFALMGGYHSPSPFDPLFSQVDPDGQITSRLDVVSATIDWWDQDTERTIFDPGAGSVAVAGAEDDVYSSFPDPYRVKNAPFDSLEELRLIRGVGDDFWATFIEPRPDDPDSRTITIYGSGWVNANEAPPEVMLARVCSYLEDQPLCSNPVEAAKFVQLINTARAMVPVPFFTHNADFITFLEGRGGPMDLYPLLVSLLGPDNPLLFTPVTIPPDKRNEVTRAFVTAAQILTIQVTGVVGRSEVRMRAVTNFHDRWTPPPPNAGRMPALGVFHHYRID